MKDVYVRYVDSRGRITLPNSIRNRMGLSEGSAIRLQINKRGILTVSKSKDDSVLFERIMELQEELMEAFDGPNVTEFERKEMLEHLSALKKLIKT